MKTSEFLRRAWKHIDEYHKWTKGTLGKDEWNQPCSSVDIMKAISFCSRGACEREHEYQKRILLATFHGDERINLVSDQISAKNKAIAYLDLSIPDEHPCRLVAEYNDHPDTTYEDIKKLWSRAIQLAEKDEMK